MSSFCRITGKAKDLPKPNFFPIIPPISPADARKLCKITGRRMDDHNFVPLLEFGKHPECVRCRVTGTGNVKKEKIKDEDSITNHTPRDDYKYVTPILKKEAIDKEYLKSFEDLQKLLKRLQKTLSGPEAERNYVYLLPSVLCGIIVPAEVEEAIRLGELESLSISKSCNKAIFKIKGRPTMFIPLKESDISQADAAHLFEGRGQSKETIGRQRKALEDKKRKMFATRKIFEDLEKAADEEMLNDQDRPRGKARIFGGISKEARQYRQKILDFREMYTPEGNMAVYGHWQKALKVDVAKFDWEKLSNVKSVELEGPLPKKAKLSQAGEDNRLADRKRIKNFYNPGMTGLEIVPAVEEVNLSLLPTAPELIHLIINSKQDKMSTSGNSTSLKSMFSDEDTVRNLPTLTEFLHAVDKLQSAIFTYSNVTPGFLYNDGDMAKFSTERSSIPSNAKIVAGIIVRLEDGPVFLPGETITVSGEDRFTPGQRMSSVDGEFIPGASVRTKENRFQFLPGVSHLDPAAGEGSFQLGQFLEPSEGSQDGKQRILFVRGQVVHTGRGPMFIEGTTVATADGLKFVAGLCIDTEIGPSFVCGTLIDKGDVAMFVAGQMLSTAGSSNDEPGEILFIPGQMGEIMEKQVFVPGHTVTLSDGQQLFLHGQMVETEEGPVYLFGDVIVNNRNQVQFLPGQLLFNPDREKEEFIPGIIGEMSDGSTGFIEGKFVLKGEAALFVPGKTSVFIDGVSNRFDKVNDSKSLVLQKSPSAAMLFDNKNLSMIFKKARPCPGVMVQTKNGLKFYPDGKLPSDLDGAELLPGRMEYCQDGPRFVPGKVMEINGVKTFIPGKMIIDENGEEIFVPGKMIETKNGPKFVPGQVIETAEGEKFIPGQIMNSPDGPKFVPGQVIQTKSGPRFIPGQVIHTDNGMKFVPGQIVETEHGAVFVPGQVIDSPDGCKFLPGQVIDTPDGPRLLPPDLTGGEGEFCVQGFDINQEEMHLLLGASKAPMNVTDILSGAGGSTVGSDALTALAMGFKAQSSNNVIAIFGEKEEEKNVEKILEDEMLDCYDTPPVRQIIKSVFIAVFAEICENIDEVVKMMDAYINGNLSNNIHKTVMSRMKLNPAIEALKNFFQEKNPSDPKEYEIMNLISGIISCSIPGALKECCDNADDVEERKLKATLLSCIEDSIRSILQEEGVVPKGLIEDIKELIQLAKDLEFEGNQSFFAKVAAVTEGRCNSQFMNTLLRNFSEKASLPNFGFDLGELLNRLIQILAPRLHLQRAFHIMSHNRPNIVKDVLNTLKGDVRDIEGFTAIDILHHAIVKVMNRYCQEELDAMSQQLDQDPLGCLSRGDGLAALLEQAVGLATYMRQHETAAILAELMQDPKKLTAIKDDPVIIEVLKKLFCMRQLAERDAEKQDKVARLQRFGSADWQDVLLQELWDQCEALTRPPATNKKLKKSKSMVKKSRSLIMSAKDIPMNAFLAMKTSASEKDESWLQNFLSESVVEEIPWECSKALIILKEGYQAIIPREASRSILLGEASYTLIDDNGIEFFLSPMDKRRRRMEGKEEGGSTGRMVPNGISNMEPPREQLRPRRPPAAEAIIEEEEEEGDFFPRPSPPPPAGSHHQDIGSIGRSGLPSLDDLPQPFGRLDLGSSAERPSGGPSRGRRSLSSRLSSERSVDNRDTEDDFGFPRPSQNLPRGSSHDTGLDDTESLEKYRPHNYEFSKPKSEDINDLVDFYSNYRPHGNRASRLGGGYQRQRSLDEPEDSTSAMGTVGQGHIEPHKKFSDPGQYAYSQQPRHEGGGGHLNGGARQQRPTDENGFFDMDSIDPATRLILERARQTRARPVESCGPSFLRGEQQAHEDDFSSLRPPPEAQRDPRDSCLSSATRSMLDKLRESTQALQGLTEAAPDELFALDRKQNGAPAAARRKKSRFLHEDLSTRHEDEDQEQHQAASRLANDILGIRNDSMGEYDKLRPEPSSRTTAVTTTLGTRSRRYLDDDDMSLLPKIPTSRYAEDDDTDAMIQSLKQKTSRKHMSDILDEIERSEPAVKFEPIPKFKDTFKLSPSPEPVNNSRRLGAARASGSLGRPKKSSASSFAVGDGYGLEDAGSTVYGHRSIGPYYETADTLGGGGVGHYGSLGRSGAKNYNQQHAQAAYGQTKAAAGFYSNNGLLEPQPPLYGVSQPAYGYPQPAMYGQAVDPYDQDLYGGGGYGKPSYSQPMGQPRMTAASLRYNGLGQPSEPQAYGLPTGGYAPMGASAYGSMGGLYGPQSGLGDGYDGFQPNSRQQRHHMRQQQMYNMGGGWQ